MYVPAFSSVSGHNTARNARPKLVERADDGVVVKTYYPRERVQARGPTWRERAESAWAAKQERERRRLEAIDKALDKAIASAKAVEAYRIITVASPGAQLTPVRSIINRIAAKHGLTAEIILGPRRSTYIVIARHEAICEAARLRPDMTLPELGRAFKRDHTVILYVLRKAGLPTRRQHSDRET